MTPKTLEILTHPTGHIVYPHNNQAELVQAVSLFADSGLRNGEAVILIVTPRHCQAIRERLGRAGFNLEELEMNGRLVCKDAEALLSAFLFDRIIDDFRFKTTLGRLIERARTANGKRRPVRVFGEMVDLLWRSDPVTTQRMEELWNEVIEAHSVPLLCAYCLTGAKVTAIPEPLRACHSLAIA
jgi:hypothetical protein